jgi:hypothetical protein
MRSSVLAFMLISFTSLLVVQQAFGDHPEMRAATSGGTVEVLLEPSPLPIEDKESMSFKLTFLQPGTDIVQPHVDYDFVIEKDDKQVFSAAAQTGQPYLHTAEPIVYIPYKFEEQDEYSIRVTVYAIYFFPLEPETATFQVAVTPEFPFALLVAAAAFASAAGLARLKHSPRSSYGFR